MAMNEKPEIPARLHHVPAESCSPNTAQTPGMRRVAAISGDQVGAQGMWMGMTTMAPRSTSGPHHHGSSETAIYILSGNPVFIYREGDEEVSVRTKPGDFVYVPPFAHHIESNAGSDQEAVVVIARTTQEAIVENLEAL
jgi:uncharacterized RmlC-like cupin family protein